MKLYVWIEGNWRLWTGAITLADAMRDKCSFREAGYCVCVVKR